MTDRKERPILFSGPMVPAILAGRKTQTRRVVKAPVDFLGAGGRKGDEWDDPAAWGWEDPENPSHFLTLAREPDPELCSAPIPCPWGKPGDLLWVQETWSDAMSDSGPVICYKADLGRRYLDLDAWPIEYDRYPGCKFANWAADLERGIEGCWRPSVHMSRWASRITLRITDVRVERLQEISEADKIAEGATPERPFGTVWRQINTKPGIRWEDNPWVWVIRFERTLED